MQAITTDTGYETARRVRAAAQWMVRSGSNLVGPVSLELLERGLAAGKIPPDAEMAHADGSEWRRVAEVYPELAPADPGSFARHSLTPLPEPPPPPSISYLDEPVTIPRQGIMAALFG